MSTVIETNTLNHNRINTKELRFNSSELKRALHQFIGTERWFRHPINKQVVYTDGVKFFAENGGAQGAYWFIDKVAIEICPMVKHRKEDFAVITFVVNSNNSAYIRVTDGNKGFLASYEITYTDMQPGVWKFFLIDDGQHQVLLLTNEY
jgi:Family of unknown function (DUF6876)